MARYTIFIENSEGVHIEQGEFTLCGDSFDIGTTEGEECGDTKPTKSRIVTCGRCIAIIRLCSNVKFKE
jgi:hypothetical protein